LRKAVLAVFLAGPLWLGLASNGGRGPGLYPGVHFRSTRPWIKATGEWRAEGSSLDAQFKPEEILDQAKWEEFLRTATIVAEYQMKESEGVTRPWVLTLEKDGVKHQAIWKDAIGRMKGYMESWKAEIATYRLSKHLGLNMVPPTMEKERQGKSGSCQLWVVSWKDYFTIVNEERQPPPNRVNSFLRALSLQRAFDNLIANADRHGKNYLITEDWRMILIDHSRSFRKGPDFTTKLLYDETNRVSRSFIMDQLPRKFVEILRALTAPAIRDIVGEYLADEEIADTLKRRDLMTAWIDKHILDKGEAYVLY